MGLFNFLIPTQTIITEDEVIVMKGSKIIYRERKEHHHEHEHHHHRTTKLIVSAVALFDQSNPNLIISKTQGEIMANTFGKKQGVVYTIAPQKDDQSTGAIDLNTLVPAVDNLAFASVTPDPNNPLTGRILGIDDGTTVNNTVVVNWTALSAVGRKQVSGSITLTLTAVQAPPPLPDTSGDATSLGITTGDAFNQDGSPIV